MRPLWRRLFLSVWGIAPVEGPCCLGTRRPISRLIDPTVRSPSITRRRHASSPTIAVPSLA